MDYRRPNSPQLWLLALFVPLILLLVAAPVLATEAPTESDPEVEQTEGVEEGDADVDADADAGEEEEADVGSELGIVPVNVAPPPEANDQDPQWTQRFLAPVVMLLGIVGVIAASVFYGVRIRGRYKVVD